MVLEVLALDEKELFTDAGLAPADFTGRDGEMEEGFVGPGGVDIDFDIVVVVGGEAPLTAGKVAMFVTFVGVVLFASVDVVGVDMVKKRSKSKREKGN